MGGDNPPAPINETLAQQMATFTKQLPDLMSAINSQITPTAQASQNAQNQVAPQNQALQNDLFKQFAPGLNDTGNAINRTNALAQANTNNAVVNGPGTDLVHSLDALQRGLDPEYYNTRATAGAQTNNLLNSINLNGLSGSERAEVERSNAQQDASRGILNTPSQTATTQNAMNFGSALAGKQARLGTAIGQATNFMNGAQGPVNATNTIFGQPQQGNQGAGQFQGTAGSTANTNQGGLAGTTGNGLMSNIGAQALNNANITANQRDSLDRVTGVLSSLPT